MPYNFKYILLLHYLIDSLDIEKPHDMPFKRPKVLKKLAFASIFTEFSRTPYELKVIISVLNVTSFLCVGIFLNKIKKWETQYGKG